MKPIALFSYVFCLSLLLNGQERKNYNIHTVAFYNLENLFDTKNDPNKLDEASPIMELKGDIEDVYRKKIKNMARVISEIGKDVTHNAPAIIGVSEVENRDVLEDLVKDPNLIEKDYGIVHYNSPDIRGIDVGLLYQKQLFTPVTTSRHELKIYDYTTHKRVYTRDQLLVTGYLDNEKIHLIVNHWPSRSGGETRSKPKRIAAAKLTKRIVDSLQSINPYAKIFILGDLNDNPNNTSVKDILKTKKNKNLVGLKGIYNPFDHFFKKGNGTTAFRDSWSLFDQILITKPLLEKDYTSFRFYKAGIFNKQYLITSSGKYKGYPFRSWSHGRFSNGFSDHFPVYIYVIKTID